MDRHLGIRLLLDELIDASEYGLGLDVLVDGLLAEEVRVSADIYRSLVWLADEMSTPRHRLGELRSLVADDGW
jgi:hypothetical protein